MVHQNLKKLREDYGLTQQEVADYLHMSQNTISKIELGHQKLDIELFIKLATFYKVSPHTLLHDDNIAAISLSDQTEVSNIEVNDLIVTLTEQLKEKDKQIEVLMSMLKNKTNY